jgi:DMSO/TMAO reductase YedYZ molybdopterin-dependent catalytic subunit
MRRDDVKRTTSPGRPPRAATSLVVLLAFAAALLAGCAGGNGADSNGSGDSKGGSAGDSWGSAAVVAQEMTDYEGVPLSTFYRQYDNSIKGPQSVDLGEYRLRVTGLVEEPLSLTYEEVLAHDTETRMATLFCVEGWHERLVFEGVRLADVLARARPREGAVTIVFHAVDDYTTSLPYDDVERLDLMLAAKINGIPLDERRGMPFQLVAEGKQGYKWIRWLTGIELSDEPYSGFWERRGYSNEADVQPGRIERERELIERREPASPTPD